MADPLKPGATWDGTDPRTGKKYTWDGGYYYDQPVPEVPPETNMNPIQISRAFSKLGGDKLADFGQNVHDHMENNTAFTQPTVTMPNLETAVNLFRDCIVAVKDGGHPAVLAKKAARADLDLKLRTLADYIERLSGMTEAVAATSGFIVLEHTTHNPATPNVPLIKKVYNVATTKLGVHVTISGYYRVLEFRVTAPGKAPQLAGTSTSTHETVLSDLVPGTVYAVECRAGAGHKNFSEWSDPVSHMCT